MFQRRGRERPEGTDTAGRAAETQDWIWARLDLSTGHFLAELKRGSLGAQVLAAQKLRCAREGVRHPVQLDPAGI